MDGHVMDWLIVKSCPSRLDELQEFHKKLIGIQDVVKEKINLLLQERHPMRPYPQAFMDLASKYMIDWQTSTHISSMAPNSNHGLVDGSDVIDSLASGLYATDTSTCYPNDQLDG
ncbi:hypothetical protein HU200_038634 [Digitaria exilis]|uniref:Uncharacterized protein n=1 Tax=Digitaria exilis TaxID=1010633 RepID=A0A835BAZ1_9POAL|nr:hypothetical protein HU200_038634 [Digitaria exilis]